MADWTRELKKVGWEEMLLDKLRFHKSLRVRDVSISTGRSERVAYKHIMHLVQKGKASWTFQTSMLGEWKVTMK